MVCPKDDGICLVNSLFWRLHSTESEEWHAIFRYPKQLPIDGLFRLSDRITYEMRVNKRGPFICFFLGNYSLQTFSTLCVYACVVFVFACVRVYVRAEFVSRCCNVCPKMTCQRLRNMSKVIWSTARAWRVMRPVFIICIPTYASICPFDRCSSFCVDKYLAAGVYYVVLEGHETGQGTAEIIFNCEARTSCLII